MSKSVIICRCEDVTEEDVIQAIEQGARSLEDVKKITRAGMGYCQGKTCRRQIARLLSEKTGCPIEQFLPGSFRMPAGPIRLELLAGTEEMEE